MPLTEDVMAEARALAAERAEILEAGLHGDRENADERLADVERRGKDLARRTGDGWRYENGGLMFSSKWLGEEY